MMNHSSGQAGTSAIAEAARQETVLDVDTQRVARVYAEALYRAAEKRGIQDDVLTALTALVQEVFRADPQVETFLSSGAIDRGRKAEVIRSVFAKHADEVLVNFLLVLNDHDRLNLLRAIVAEYQELRDRRAGIMRVEVRSAMPIREDQQERLRQELRATYHQEPVLEINIEPDLLGGIIIRVGDRVFDRSVKSELEDIRNQIIARSSYEIQSGRNRFRVDA